MISELLKAYMINKGEMPKYLLGKLDTTLLEEFVSFIIKTQEPNFSNNIDNIEEKSSRFSIRYNVRYLGEFIERLEEKEITKDNKKLLSVVYAMAIVNNYSSLETLYNQKEIYENSVRKHLEANYDELLDAMLLYSVLKVNELKKSFADSKYFKDLKRIILNLNRSKDFYKGLIILSIVGQLVEDAEVYIKDNSSGLKELLKQSIEDLLTTATPIDIENNALLLNPLCEVYEDVFNKPKAKEFKNSNTVKFLMGMRNLGFKEIDINDIEKVKLFLKLKDKQVYFINYFLNKNINNRYSKVTGPGYCRIIKSMVSRYYTDIEDIPSIIDTMALQNEIEFKEVIYKDILKGEDFSQNIERFRRCYVQYKQGHFSDNKLILKRYVLDNKNFRDILNHEDKNELILTAFHETKTREEYLKVDAIRKEYVLEKEGTTKYEFDYSSLTTIRHKEWEFGISQFNNKEINADSSYRSDFFSFINKNRTPDERIDILINIVESIGLYNLKKDLVEKLLDFAGWKNARGYYYYSSGTRYRCNEWQKNVGSILKEINEYKTKLKELLELVEKVVFIHLPREYEKFIYTLYKCEEYRKVLGIGEEEYKKVLHSLVENNLLEERERNEIKESLMTEDEKRERDRLLEIQKMKKKIDESRNATSASNLRWSYLNSIKDKEVPIEIKEEIQKAAAEKIQEYTKNVVKKTDLDDIMVVLLHIIKTTKLIDDTKLADLMRNLKVDELEKLCC